MKKSLIGLAALASAGMMATQAALNDVHLSTQPPPPRRRRSTAQQGTSHARLKPSSAHFYPEQSTRQEMRGYRRAQGGPGIVLVNGTYQPL